MWWKIFYMILLSNSVVQNMYAQRVELSEDAYIGLPSSALIDQAQQVAQRIGFTGKYELVIPKKPALELNPWNNFIAVGINPVTKNLVIIVNEPWFSTFTTAEQEFLLGHYFLIGKRGLVPFSARFIRGLCIGLYFILLILIAAFLNRMPLSRYKFIFFNIMFACIIGFSLGKVLVMLQPYIFKHHEKKGMRLAAQIMGDHDAACSALQRYDAAIKAEVAQGNVFWQPHAHIFEEYFKALSSD